MEITQETTREDLLNEDLGGWRIKVWFKIEYPYGPGKSGLIEYFAYEDTALAAGLTAGHCGTDIQPERVYILSHETSKIGFLLESNVALTLKGKEEIIREKKAAILDKMSPGEKKIMDS